MRKNILPAYATALLLSVSGAATALPMYTITDLGDLPGGSDTINTTAINNSGQVVGYRYAGGRSQAFIWDPSGGMINLGNLLGGFGSSFATGINNLGQVVGFGSTPTGNRSFLWDSADGMINLGALTSGFDESYARSINDNSQVVGSVADGGFLWDATRGVINLGGFPGGNGSGVATRINNLGQVVGVAGGAAGARGFLWDSGVMTDLGDLPGGIDQSVAYGINNNGQVVGSSSAATGTRAFLWDSVGGMTDLGDLPGGDDLSIAFDINDSGQVVGYGIKASGSAGAFVWDSVNGMLDLNDLHTDPTGWNLSDAAAINASGQIAGTGFHNGVQRGFLLTPVDAEPTTDIRYININSDGDISCECFNPAYPTVVVTHGWQNALASGLDPLDQEFPLSHVSTAVASRALEEGQSLNLITYQWDGAYTKENGPFDLTTGATTLRYNAAATGTYYAGYDLGRALNGLFNAEGAYSGETHMIGHSLGTVVNAQALNFFPTLGINQFTVLDAPSDLPFDSFNNFSSEWFNTMLREHQITYVDNFYGDHTFYGNGVTAVGAPIDNAARNGGTVLSGLGHTEVHAQFYSPHIGETGWVTPIFGLDETIFYARPGPRIWEPQETTISAPESASLNDFPIWGTNFGTTEIDTLDLGGTAGTTAMVLIPQSPVSISQHFYVPDGSTLLMFDFGFLDPGTGEFLQLYFDDILLWEMPWINDLVGELLNAVVPIDSLAGLSGDLTFLLDSTNGNAQARAFLTNFEVMGQFVETASVPEPGTMLLLGTGLLALAGMRRKLAA